MHHCGLSCDIRGYQRHNESSSVDWNDEKFIWNYWNQSASEFKCCPLQFLDCVFTDLNTSDHLLRIVSAVWDRTQSQTEILLFGLEIDTTQLCQTCNTCLSSTAIQCDIAPFELFIHLISQRCDTIHFCQKIAHFDT